MNQSLQAINVNLHWKQVKDMSKRVGHLQPIHPVLKSATSTR